MKKRNMTEKQKKIVYEYIEELKLQKRKYKHRKSSVLIYCDYLVQNNIEDFYVTIAEAQEFQQYLTTLTKEDGTLNYSSSGVATLIGRIVTFYDHLKKKKIIHMNPFREISKVRRSKSLPKNILNEEDLNKLLMHLKNFAKERTFIRKRQLYRAHVIAEFLYSTGARINEVSSLRDEDIDFVRGTVLLSDQKTGKEREGILNSFAEKVLSIYINEMRPFVTIGNSNDKTVFGASNSLVVWFNNVINRECEKLGLGKFPSHNFRHAVGYHLLRAGCDIRFIQEILGHVELSTTQVYTKVVKEDLKNVIDTFHPRFFRRDEK